ncbi:MAG: dodecin family protein [Cellvibrionaceae bacterium]
MSVARVTEVIASSPTSFEGAVQEGISRASKTLKNIRSAWVKDQEVVVEGNRVSAYRVNLMITFVLED